MLPIAFLLVLASVVAAQAAPPPILPGAVEPGRNRPEAQLPSQPEVDFRMESTQRSPIPRAVDTVHFQLNGLKITGTKVFPEESFRPLYESMIGKDVTLSDILHVADEIEARYREAGYLLVRAYVPPQRVKDGIFTIDVVEGYVEGVSVEGTSPRTQGVTMWYLHDTIGQQPLTLASIERGLLLANDIPGVTAVGTLRASPSTPGASELIINEVAPWITGGLAVDNRGSRFSGIWTLSGDVAFNDLLGADQLAFVVDTSPDAKEQVSGQATYRAAIGPDGLIGSAYGVYTHGQPGSTLAIAGVLTDSWAAGGHLSFPLIRQREASLRLEGGFAFQDARIGVSGIPLSLDQWRVIDVGLTTSGTGFLDMSWGGAVDLAQGLPIFGATKNGSPELSRVGATTDFTKIDASFQVVRPIVDDFSVAAGASGQVAFDHLIIGEEVSYGGTLIVRGYDPGAITGDDGIGGWAELRYDNRIPQWYIENIEPYVFVAGAGASYIHAAKFGLKNESIAAVGGGVRLKFPYNFLIDAEVDRTLTAVPGSDAGREATKVLMDAAITF